MSAVVSHLHQLPGGGFTPDDPVVALTFDDGPGVATDDVATALARLGVPGTFFVVGSIAVEEPGLLAGLVAAGHTVGGHSWSHRRVEGLADGVLLDEAARTAALIEEATARPARYFRPPYRKADAPRWAEVIAPLGLVTVTWSVDPRDWESSDPVGIATSALDHLRCGAIVLLHDGGGDRMATVEALPLIVQGARLAGYRFVALP
jgi:peptidoglycan/xylan/chitin deacetylase (PgdA/CDA1 family)